MALGKPSPVSIILAVVMIGVIGYLAWSATQKSDDTSYSKGATHNQTSLTVAPVENNYPLALPRCGRTFDIDSSWLQPKNTGNPGKDKK